MKKIIEKYFYLILISLIIIFFILFKIFIGEVNINNSHTFTNPIYELYVNDELKGLDMVINKKRTIIPFILYSTSTVALSKGEVNFDTYYGSDIILKIKGLNCYANIDGKNILSPCNNYDNKYTEEIKNIKIDKMIITEGLKGLNGDYVYDGEFKENVKDLLPKKGRYVFRIYLHHDGLDSTILFIMKLK